MSTPKLYDTVTTVHPHDQCGSRSGWTGPTCNLERDHDGDHAEVSLSGLVLSTWPWIRLAGCEFCGDDDCDCAADW